MIERLYTTGVYGKTEEQFFAQLADAQIELFCDIRQRRGVRGAQYRFVNRTYLQQALANRSIGYLYVPLLAPTTEIRETQHAIDETQGIAKRARTELGGEFKRRYIHEVLDRFDTNAFLDSIDPHIQRMVLFCVEAKPEACHRSLVADCLARDWKIPVEHL